MVAAAIAASSAREMVLVIPMDSRNEICFSKGGIHLILCLALICVFLNCHQCRSNTANLVLYKSGLGSSCVGSLCQSSEVIFRVLVLSWGPCEVRWRWSLDSLFT